MVSIPVKEAETSYPENRKLGTSLPASGLYLRHADNVVISNVRFHFREPDARPLIVTDDCTGIIER